MLRFLSLRLILPVFRPLYDLFSENKCHPRANRNAKMEFFYKILLYNIIIEFFYKILLYNII